MYKEGKHCKCNYRVNNHGDCFTQNRKGEWIHRDWRYNHDGYPVVSACGIDDGDKVIYRSLQVHILVAEQFVDGWFDEAEVNHKDFNRANPDADNLEWTTHRGNVKYSAEAGHYVGKFGIDNPNYGNDTLHKKYSIDKKLAKEKQSRLRGQNGKAIKCELVTDWPIDNNIHRFDCQRDAADFVIEICGLDKSVNKEYIIKNLKREQGYKGWYLTQI